MADVARRRVWRWWRRSPRAPPVTRDCQRLRRQGAQPHQVVPVVEQTPLGGVDAAGVVGKDGFQTVGHGPVGGAQGIFRGGRGTICESPAVVVMGAPMTGFRRRFQRVKDAR